MHMNCNSSFGGCGHEFCWLCRGSWTEHGSHTGGYFACNKYDTSQYSSIDKENEKLKQEIELYMFYYHRYESHRQAKKIADVQRRNATQKAQDVITKFSSIVQDTKFLCDAIDQILENRKVLSFSYVFGYYLNKTKTVEHNLFEYLQAELEKKY